MNIQIACVRPTFGRIAACLAALAVFAVATSATAQTYYGYDSPYTSYQSPGVAGYYSPAYAAPAQAPYYGYGYAAPAASSGYGYGYAPSYGYGGGAARPAASYRGGGGDYHPYYYGGPQNSGTPDPNVDKNTTIYIDLSRREGRFGDYTFAALGGGRKHPTPTGTFTVKMMHKDFYSRKYDAPMPYSIFFTSQCAIHDGDLQVHSHGCIHVDPSTAAYLFAHAKSGVTKVVVTR